MKSIKFIIALIAVSILSISSCEEELSLNNPNQLSPETFFKTETQLQSAVIAPYTAFQTLGLYARGYFYMVDLMSGDFSGNPQLEADKRIFLNWSYGPSDALINDLWNSCYLGVNRTNFVLDNLENAVGVSDATKEEIEGEMKFLRAYFYFILQIRFGGVPLILTSETEGQPRTPKADIVAQIIADLEDAEAMLPSYASQDFGRASSEAATAMLGKMHLFNQDYDAAQTAFASIYGDFALTDNYFDNFMEETEDNSETIFDIVMESDFAGDSWTGSGQGTNGGTFLNQDYGMTWFNVYPSDALLDEFEPGDTRFDDSFIEDGDPIGPEGDKIAADVPLDRRAAWMKYSNYYKQTGSTTRSGINFNGIRYADVLLMMAEVENELNDIPQALIYMNEVRNRTSVSMPNYPTAEYPCTTKAEVFDAIKHERRVELAGEQIRFDDLLRWGIADNELATSGSPESVAFDPTKHTVLPIPQPEIDINDALTSDDQNPNF